MQIDTYTMGVWGKREFSVELRRTYGIGGEVFDPPDSFMREENHDERTYGVCTSYTVYELASSSFLVRVTMGQALSAQNEQCLERYILVTDFPSLLMFMKEYTSMLNANSIRSIASSLDKVAEHLYDIKSGIDEYMDR